MKRIFSLLFAMLFINIFAFALGSKESKPVENYDVKTAVIKGPSGIGAIYLFEDSVSVPEGSSFSVEALASVDAMSAKILSKEIDIGIVPVNMAAKLYNSGVDYKLAAVCGKGMLKILTNDSSINNPKDLLGKEVYIAGQGATPEYLMRVVLKNIGMDPEKDIQMLFNMPYPEMANSLAAGKISTAVLPEPFATLAQKTGKNISIPFSLSEMWTDATGQEYYPMTVIIVKSELLEKAPSIVKEVLEAYSKSIEKVNSNPEEAATLIEKHELGLKAAIAKAAIPSCALSFTYSKEAKSSVEALLKVFLDLNPKSIGGKLPDDLWYIDFE